MAYVRKPNYHFRTKLDTGIDKVPNGRVVVVEDFDGVVKTFVKSTNTGLTGTSTIVDAITGLNIKESGVDQAILDGKLSKTGGTMTGAITGLRETSVTMTANNIDLAAGNVFHKTISGSTTFTISNSLTTGNVNSFTLRLTNAGSSVITWFPGVKWASGTAPTLTASGVDRISFESIDGGVTWEQCGILKDIK